MYNMCDETFSVIEKYKKIKKLSKKLQKLFYINFWRASKSSSLFICIFVDNTVDFKNIIFKIYNNFSTHWETYNPKVIITKFGYTHMILEWNSSDMLNCYQKLKHTFAPLVAHF